MSTAAIAVMARKKKMIRLFRNAGAINMMNAADPEELGMRKSLLFNKMAGDGIFINRGDGKYYLDEAREAFISARRRKAMLILLAVVLLLLIIGSFLATGNN